LFEGEKIKQELKRDGRSIKWLWRIVRTRGFGTLAYTRFIEILNGSYLGGYAPKVIKTAMQILEEGENKRDAG
jgi:hypothetical protein